MRGFRENALLRDNGLYANLEWRVPLWRNGRGSRWNLTAVPFFDYGRVWDQGDSLTTSSASRLSSIGLGFTATPFRGAAMELFYGERLKKDDLLDRQERDLQDDGIHFSFSYQWSPR